MYAALSFLALNLLIAGFTWWRGRRLPEAHEYFLGARRLSAPFVALSVLMTNFSTEQLIGLNGDAFRNGIAAMAWEVFGAFGLVVSATIFLPRYYTLGVTTIPEYVEQRCGRPVRRLMSTLMLLSLCIIAVPFVLYSGTLPLVMIFGLPERLGLPVEHVQLLGAFVLGGVGLVYALLGGMRGVATSDVLYAMIFFAAATLVPLLGLHALGDGNIFHGVGRLVAARPAALNPFGNVGQPLPPTALLTGMVVINISAWCAHQGPMQKAFAAASLSEGQKGLLLAAVVKLLSPFFFVLPGLIAWALLDGQIAHPDMSYAWLVTHLLPDWLVGFFAAAIAGATITSVSGFVHSATSLFALDLLDARQSASRGRLTDAGRWFGIVVVTLAVLATPLIAQQQTGFFAVMKRLNATLTIPVVSVVVMAVLTRRTWPRGWVPLVMVTASATYLITDLWLRAALAPHVSLHWLHSVGLTFAVAVALLFLRGQRLATDQGSSRPRTGWRHSRLAGLAILTTVTLLYTGLVLAH